MKKGITNILILSCDIAHSPPTLFIFVPFILLLSFDHSPPVGKTNKQVERVRAVWGYLYLMRSATSAFEIGVFDILIVLYGLIPDILTVASQNLGFFNSLKTQNN